ncbi:MAG: hypothetical protein IJ341_12600 [Bacteroidales bacterium]|nr:hypothetical protein [Bacteroidales bacterium]
MAAMTGHAWSKVRQRLQQMIQEDSSLASPGDQNAQITVFEDPTVQKFIRPLISKQGEDMAFEVFCNYFNNTVNSFIEMGIVAEDELVPANSGMAG